MHEIKIIAPKYPAAPLSALGISVFPAENGAEAEAALREASGGKEAALIFITESLAADLQEEIEKQNRRPEINIMLIPDNRGKPGLAGKQIEALIRNSIGADVIIRK